MPDVTLTPVGGDPFAGGAHELDPVTAPPLTVSLGPPQAALVQPQPPAPTPVEQGAAMGDPTDYAPQQPLPGTAETLSSLGSGHAYDDYDAAMRAALAGMSTAGKVGAGALTVAASPILRGLDSATGAARYIDDAQAGRLGTDLTDPATVGRMVPGAVNVAGLMAAPGMGMAEEGAAGVAGGKLFPGGRTDAQQLTAIQKAMDALVRPGKAAPAAAAPMSIQDQMAALLRGETVDSAPLAAAAAEMHPRALPADRLAQGVPDGHFQAFHGSPAQFDRFSMDHLGTGEGAQAYGHGMYFAGDQNVGAFYADAYGQPRTLPDGSIVNGHMYQVAIPGHPDQFFNQDLSLAEQSPSVRAAVAPLYEAAGLDPEYRGGNLLHEMKQNALQSGVPYRDIDQHVSRQFQNAGIPGHSYGGGGDAPNYVVFDPSGVRVMKTYANGDPSVAALTAELNGRQPGFTVYHGSPHRFDAFDMSKIGTGEGAQSYGHGMYFTDTEDVAKGYRDALSEWNVNGKPASSTNPNHIAAVALAENKGDIWQAANSLGNKYGNVTTLAQSDALKGAAKMLFSNERPSGRYKVSSTGHMYEVGVNADPDHFLDYDKPLNQQTQHVQDALAAAGLGSSLPADARGKALYRDMTSRAKGDGTWKEGADAASQRLAAAGIPGIRYLDGFSRGVGEGTSNYVLFDPARDAEIRRIYAAGLPIPGAAPAQDPPPDPRAQALAAALRAGK